MGRDIAGHIPALHQHSQILILEIVQKLHRLRNRRLRVRREREFDLVILGPITIVGDDSELIVADRATLGEEPADFAPSLSSPWKQGTSNRKSLRLQRV